MIRAVLFDLDDTLYPEATFIRSALAEVAPVVAAQVGENVAAVQAELEQLTFGGQRGRTFDSFLERRDRKDPVRVRQWVCRYREHRPTGLRLFSEVPAVLAELRGLGLRLGLLTGGDAFIQRNKVEVLALPPRLDVLVFAGLLGPAGAKPAPDAFWLAAEKLGVSPEAVLTVGDRLDTDIRGARAAGMRAVLIRRGAGPDMGPPVGPDRPDAVVRDLNGLSDWLSGLR